MKIDIEKEFNKAFPRFGADDDYCAPAVYTLGENPGRAFDGEEILSGDKEIREALIAFIKRLTK